LLRFGSGPSRPQRHVEGVVDGVPFAAVW
jgi:hypothetical protein